MLDDSIACVRRLVYLQVWQLFDDLQNLLDRVLIWLHMLEVNEIYSAEQDKRVLVKKVL